MTRNTFKQAGLSMIELMISIAVGLIVVSGVIGMFVSTVTSNAENIKMTRLNQEMRAVMDVMVRDIRRAGYRGDVTTATTANPFTTGSNDLTVNGTNDCITFTYDSTALDNPAAAAGRGLVDAASDVFGNRREVVSGVGVIRSGIGAAVTLGTCTAGTWSDLTDGDSVDITQLQFTVAQVPTLNPTVRSVTITLTGQLKGNTTVNRTITETVQMINI